MVVNSNFFIVTILVGGVVYARWRLQQERPTDRPAIKVFAMERGLRVLTITRPDSSWKNILRFGTSNTARFYDVAVEDATDDDRGTMHIAFDTLRGGKLIVLERDLVRAPTQED